MKEKQNLSSTNQKQPTNLRNQGLSNGMDPIKKLHTCSQSGSFSASPLATAVPVTNQITSLVCVRQLHTCSQSDTFSVCLRPIRYFSALQAATACLWPIGYPLWCALDNCVPATNQILSLSAPVLAELPPCSLGGAPYPLCCGAPRFMNGGLLKSTL